MSAAPIVDDLVVACAAEAAADRLLRDQAPVAEDMDGKAARSGRSMRWLGSAELAPSVCACCSPAGSSCHSVGWVRRRTEPTIGVGQILDPIEGEGGRVQGWPRGRRAPSWQGVPRGGAHGSPGLNRQWEGGGAGGKLKPELRVTVAIVAAKPDNGPAEETRWWSDRSGFVLPTARRERSRAWTGRGPRFCPQAPMEVSRPAMPSDQMAGPCPFLHFIASDARSTTQT